MKKLLLLFGLLLATPSFAADNAVIVTPGTGVTMKSKDIGAGVQMMQQLMCDPTTPAQCMVFDASGRPTVNINGTVPVSAASLPLPTGAATAAKQPALGTAGTPSADVISVQGVTSMTALKTDGSGVTQPVSGTITANAGTNLNTSALATQTTLASVLTQDTATATGVGTPTDAVATAPASGSSATMIALLKALLNTGQYPSGATAITASATGTTAATTATLAGAVGKTTYICGMSIRANATAAATGNATVTGTITGTLNFTQWTAPTASGLGVTEQIFNPCVPASATNTGIAIISAAPGTGGVVSSTGWGYQL